MARHRLTDEQWECIADIFPPPKNTGRPRADLRNVVDALVWMLCTGTPWRDLPEAEFGPWETVFGWFNTMAETEAFDHDLWAIDGSVVRAHRCATGGGKKATRASRKTTHWAAVVAGFQRRSTSSAMAKGTRYTSS